MKIKEEIGRRIEEQRKVLGLTRKALADLTDDLKQSRINNWERGIRTPGPEEIKQLAKVLDVSPAFLMCLTDEKQPKKIPGLGALIPLLDHTQACDPTMHIQVIRDDLDAEKITFIPVSADLSSRLGEHAFALQMLDDSMEPELRRHDILIIDPDKEPKPGEFVAAIVGSSEEVIVRRYKQLSTSNTMPQFELLAVNTHWADVRDSAQIKCMLVGSVCGLSRVLK
ncbi:MAG: XRE family transcriptional regulator [Legionellaceae bacterium]|nr:XRE family transcriptional regulator [Legionellaceae bacterium]